MRRRTCANVLMVEGKQEVFVLAELLESCGIAWPKGDEPIDIREFGGVDQLLAPDVIETHLKASGLESLGILVDADSDLDARWRKVRGRLLNTRPNFPRDLPADGLIEVVLGEPRVGVWIMPDNIRAGMLETALLQLRDTVPKLHEHVRDALGKARTLGAPFSRAHEPKAELHTWLAWQEPPGLQMHMAVKAKLLRPTPDFAEGFVAWCRRLFEL